MRIRDYIRDDPLMGQKRDNKLGLQACTLRGAGEKPAAVAKVALRPNRNGNALTYRKFVSRSG